MAFNLLISYCSNNLLRIENESKQKEMNDFIDQFKKQIDVKS